MSFHEIDDTLVDYFKQMLSEESELCESDNNSKVVEASDNTKADEFLVDTSSLDECNLDNSKTKEIAVSDIENASVDTVEVSSFETAKDEHSLDVPSFDVSANVADSFVNPLDSEESVCSSLAHFESLAGINHESDNDLSLSNTDTDVTDSVTHDVKLEHEQITSTEKPFAEPHPLEKLLENVETKTETQTQDETLVQTATNTDTEDVKSENKEAQIQEEVQTDDNAKNQEEWHNIELPKEFQALFFLVKGIRFAVPLVNLGGIFQTDKVTPLFGKPKWFMGIADIRGKKMNVVDTLKWVKTDAPDSENYEYKIALDNTLWSIGCDELEGNRILSNDSVTWRQQAGNRPWLAGIVKKEMCALLHVEELIKMFEKGVNLKDLDLQMSE